MAREALTGHTARAVLPKRLPSRYPRAYRWCVRHFRQGRSGPDADRAVRQYRYVLRTATPGVLLAVNAAALAGVTPSDRDVILRAVQRQLATGGGLTAEDVPALARLLSRGERHEPRALLRHLDPLVLGRLARAALDSDAAFGLLGGYAAWDGRDAEPASPEEVDRQFAPNGPDSGTTYDVARGPGEGGSSP